MYHCSDLSEDKQTFPQYESWMEREHKSDTDVQPRKKVRERMVKDLMKIMCPTIMMKIAPSSSCSKLRIQVVSLFLL